jgi:hypothetical protein
MIRRSITTTILLLITATAGSAQNARTRADLRYTAPLPEKVSYTSTDSINVVIGGLPTGNMTTTGYTNTSVDVAFTPAGDSVRLRSQVTAIGGQMETPMGVMPVEVPLPEPTEMMIGPKGMRLDPDFGGMSERSMQDLMGMAQNSALPLVALPGRALERGESWTDTLRTKGDVGELNIDMQVIVRGTYARDTVVDGRTLNVIAYDNTMTMKSSGTYQGMAVEQAMEVTSDEAVLWDSARHHVVSRTATSVMKMDTTLPGMGAMTMNGNTRSSSRIAN